MSKRIDHVSSIIYAHTKGVSEKFMRNRSDDLGNFIYAENFRQLAEMTRARFEWQNFPKTCHEEYLERTLFESGCVVFFRDKIRANIDGVIEEIDGHFLALKGSGWGQLNHYNEHLAYKITQPFYRNIAPLTTDEAVPIFSNPMRMPEIGLVHLYAERLTRLDQTFDINAMNARRTRVVVSDANELLGNQNIVDAIDRGDPVVHVKRGLETNEFSAIDFGVDAKQLIELNTARQKLWAEAMTKLGIDNANQDKKERLVVDEVSANDSQIGAVRNAALITRQKAADLINAKFGLDIKVTFRETKNDSGVEGHEQEPVEPEGEVE